MEGRTHELSFANLKIRRSRNLNKETDPLTDDFSSPLNHSPLTTHSCKLSRDGTRIEAQPDLPRCRARFRGLRTHVGVDRAVAEADAFAARDQRSGYRKT